MEPPWDGGTKVGSNGTGRMTKKAAMPIYGKNLLLLWYQKAGDLETWYATSVLKFYKIYSNDDTGLTLTYFTARSNLVFYAFICGKR